MTISQVLGSHPEQLVSAAGDVASAAGDIDNQIARERLQLTRLASDWRGTASDTAQGHANEMFGDQELYRDRLKLLHTAMSSGGAELGSIRTRVSDLVSSPEADLFDISDEGPGVAGMATEGPGGGVSGTGSEVGDAAAGVADVHSDRLGRIRRGGQVDGQQDGPD
ncbi:WXG100 family type VII secretion target [Mycolicibacterium fortuitum]|uniref:WXG100 family type VII secretion target n=1 Tax=Mycolicibacterium fortuitum TaxID=1766 RepID=UPI001F3B8039